MKKYLICILLCPLFATAQQTQALEKFNLSLGLSVNSTTTTAAPSTEYSNRPTSSYLFPEAHVVGDLAIFGTADLLLRLEGSLTYLQNKYDMIGTNGYSSYREAFKVNQVVATVNPQLLYHFSSTNDNKFYGAAGFSLSGISAGVHHDDMASLQGGPYYHSGSGYDSKSMTRLGGNLKAGFITGRFDIYLDYNKALSTSSSGFFSFGNYNPDATANQSIFKVGVNYRIKLPAKKLPER